jgi:hypothetical protein
VLVDTSAPRAPAVNAGATADATPNLGDLGVDAVHVAGSSTIWVRAGASGSIPVQVTSADPESGVAQNNLSADGSGWRAQWIGNSSAGVLRLYYAAAGATGHLVLSAVNGAGISGPSTSITLARDATSPSAAAWVSAPSGTTKHVKGSYFRLDWTGAADTGSGLAPEQVVARYRAGLNPDGSCKTNGFSDDTGFHLAADNSWDAGLQPGSCYAWSVRTLDNVGNTSTSVLSGYVIIEPAR